MPAYWVGTMLALIFGVELKILPVAGMGGFKNLILPAITLAIPLSASLTRIVRSTMLQVLGMDYVRTAKAKGVRKSVITFKHVLRNAMIPVVTVLGLTLANLFGGAVIIENVFAWPGLGTLAVQAAGARDFPVIQGTVFFFAVVLIGANLLVDILYAVVDPRIHYS
jgi:ABC-type dipeptide/oligopeptide/nickel transport system permease component